VLGAFNADLAGEPAAGGLPDHAVRTSAFMTHPVFSRYQSEHEMLRYLRRLADRDLALDRSMIPLGSCTMKLNATTEMVPITWPEFGGIQPYAPLDQAAGYLELIEELEGYLAEITGFPEDALRFAELANQNDPTDVYTLIQLGRVLAARDDVLGKTRRALAVVPAVMVLGPFWRAVAFHLFRMRRPPAYLLSVGGSIPHALLWTGLVLGGIWEGLVWPWIKGL
jgi:hypothetical protein